MNRFNKIIVGGLTAINDLTIEKVYLKKENAEKYRDMYKESHNYSVEERELRE